MNISKKSKPVIVLRYHSEVRQEAVQQALAAMNDKPKQVGRQDDLDDVLGDDQDDDLNDDLERQTEAKRNSFPTFIFLLLS